MLRQSACRLLSATVGLALASAMVVTAQQPQVDWVRQFGGTRSVADVANAVDASGNIYVGGATGSDVFVRKCDANGVEIWTRTFGGDSGLVSVEIMGVAVDASGVVVAGSYRGSGFGNKDAFLRKYDHDGQEAWTRQFGSTSHDALHAVAMLDGSIYAVGYTIGAIVGANGGGEDMILVKYDGNGTQDWATQVPLPGDQQANAMCIVGSTIYVCGVDSYLVGTVFVRSFDAAGVPGLAVNFGIYGGYEVGYSLAGDANGLAVGGSIDYGVGPQEAFVARLTLAGAIEWVRSPGSFLTSDIGGVAVDGTGVYVSGTVYGALPGESSLGGGDAFVRKYDLSGTELWTDQFGTVDYDGALGLGSSAQGVVACGWINGFGSSASKDAFLRSYSAAGDVLWTSPFGYTTGTSDGATAVGADGSFYVAGSTAGMMTNQASAGSTDCYLRKYSSTGAELWTQQFGGTASDSIRGLAVTAAGIYVVGTARLALANEPQPTNDQGFVRLYDATGQEVWTRQFGSTSFDVVDAIAVDATGVSVCGRTGGSMDGESYPGNQQAFVRRMDLTGGHLWTRLFGSTSTDEAIAVTCHGGDTYVTGYCRGAIDGELWSGLDDAFLRKFDTNGNAQWTRVFGTTGSDGGRGVQADANGVYVAGYTQSELPGATSNGNFDMFVRSYTHAGAAVWTRQAGGSGSDRCFSLAIAANRLYLGGQVTGSSGLDAGVYQYDTAGNPGWNYTFGSGGSDSVNGAFVHDGRLALVGDTNGAILDQTSSSRTTDAFLVVLSGIDGTAGDATAPIADAGPDQSIHAGNPVSLSGSASNDETTATANLDYTWTLTSRPSTSAATLSGADTANPTLLTDQPGDYVVQLVVTDEADNVSSPDTVTVSSLNVAPTADAGPDQLGIVDQSAQLDGLASSDPDLDALTWSWTVVSAPAGSLAVIANATTGTPTFTADLPGSYELQLVVRDGFVDSAADTVTLVAVSASQFALTQLHEACTLIGGLPASAFDAQGHQKSLCNQIAMISRFVQQDDIQQALFHLADLISRVDGWTLRSALDPKGLGQPHAADFVVDQGPQQAIHAYLAAAASVLSM